MRKVLIIIALALAAPAGMAATPDPAAGAAAYQKLCARCHRDPAKLMAQSAGAHAPEDLTAWLSAYLAKHHNPGAQTAAEIAAWLALR